MLKHSIKLSFKAKAAGVAANACILGAVLHCTSTEGLLGLNTLLVMPTLLGGFLYSAKHLETEVIKAVDEKRHKKTDPIEHLII